MPMLLRLGHGVAGRLACCETMPWKHCALSCRTRGESGRATGWGRGQPGPGTGDGAAALLWYTGPAVFRSTSQAPARTVATHAALCANKQASNETQLQRNHTWLSSREADTEALSPRTRTHTGASDAGPR